MAGKDLKVALQIKADLDQARREVKGFNSDLKDTSKSAEVSSKAQQKVSKTSESTADSIKKMSSATNMQNGITQLNQYDQQLNKVTGSSAQFAESNNKVLQSLKGLAPQFLTLTAASAGFIAIATDTLNKAVDLKNQSALGGLNVEEFQYYAAGAKTVGIQTEKLGDIFKDTRDKVGDFIATGGGELQDFFENIAPKVGVTVEQFKNLNGAQSLQLIFDSLRQTGLSDNEVVFYLESVADETTALIPLLDKSGAGFKKFGDQAKASGAILSQSMVNDAIAAKNAIGEMQNEVTGLSNKLVSNFAPAITFLAQNLDVLAQAGMIAASVYVARLSPSIIAATKATITELTVKGQAIFMSKARATTLLGEATAAQIKTVAELKAAQAAVAVATGGTAQVAVQARLTAARAADTAATLIQNRAQEVYNATMSRARFSAGALLGALGGPVGLAITAAGVAASFLLMKDSAEQVTPTLDIHGQSVDELRAKYEQLGAIQKDSALLEIQKQVETTTLKFQVASSDLSAFIEALPISDDKINTYRKLNNQFIQGKISSDQYYQSLKAGNILSDAQLETVRKLITGYVDTKGAYSSTKQVQDALTSSSQSAASANDGLNKSITSSGNAAMTAVGQINNLTKAHKELLQNAQNNTFSLQYELDQRKAGISPELAAANAKTVTSLNADPKSTQTYFRAPDDIAKANALEIKTQKELNEFNEKERKNQEAISKEKEKQAKLSLTQKAISASSNEQTKNMLMVYQALAKTGLPDNAARYFTAEVGREGDFLNKNLFGSHKDVNNSYTNTGMISWQKDRSIDLMAFLRSKGVINDKGQIKQTQEALDAQAEFLANEVLNGKPYAKSKNALLSGKGYKDLQQTVGNNFIGWDIAANTLSKSVVNKNINRMDTHKNKLDTLLGTDPTELLSNVAKINSISDDFAKVKEQQEQNRLSLRESYYSDEEKLLSEHNKKIKDLNSAGYSDTELKALLEKENKRYEDALSKRPEILKRVQDSLTSLNESFLRSSDNGLQADLNSVDEKWKQPKADLASLMMTESDPLQANEYQQMLVKIDFVIDKEKLTLQFNDAMQQLEELQNLRSQRQDNLKVQYDSGQISRFQYADGLDAINADMLPTMQALAEQAKVLAENLGDAFSVAKIENFTASLTKVDTESKKFLPTLGEIEERIASGMTDAIMAWADGTKTASQAFREFASGFLREIAQMILKQMIFNAIKAITGYADGGLVTGYSSGGYTGAGGKYQEAGIVHKDEFVIRKESTSQSGAKEFLTYFNRYGMDALSNFKGYADGGLVAAPQMDLPNIQAPKLNNPTEQIAQSTSFNANQNFYLVDDPARILDVLKSGASQENLVVMMSRDPSRFKAALKL